MLGHIGQATALTLALAPAVRAAGVFAIPDPTDFTLFGMAFAGLIIGRYFVAKRPRDDLGD